MIVSDYLMPQSQKLLRDHLLAVETVLLRSRVPDGDRQTILAELRTQALEMLAARGGNDVADMAAVLAGMDPPESYAAEELADGKPVAAPRVAAPVEAFKPRHFAAGLGTGALTALFLFGLSLFHFFGRESMTDIYSQLGAELPPLSRIVYAIDHAFWQGLPFSLGAMLLCLLPFYLGMAYCRDRRSAVALFVLLMLVVLFFLGTLVIAFYTALFGIPPAVS